MKTILNLDVLDLDHEVLTEYLKQYKKHKPKTRNHLREILKGVLSFSRDRKWMEEKAFERIRGILKNESAPAESPEILTPSQFGNLLEAAKGTEVLPHIVIGGFTGARQAEILRLSWENIWSRSSHVELEAHVTKTRRRRLVPRFKVLETWLEPFRHLSGPIWDDTIKSFEAKYYRLRNRVGIRGNNLLRHSYASYRLTQVGENELAKEMGNSPDIIYSNYRELVEPCDADRWFNVLPKEKLECHTTTNGTT
jgi:integrase